MRQLELEKLLSCGSEQCELLQLETTGILRNLDTWGPEDLDRATARRQEIIEEIQKIDTARCNYLGGLGGRVDKATRQVLDQYMSVQETAIKKVLELDSLIIALGRERLDFLKGDLAALARGKTATSAYDSNYGTSNGRINDNA